MRNHNNRFFVVGIHNKEILIMSTTGSPHSSEVLHHFWGASWVLLAASLVIIEAHLGAIVEVFVICEITKLRNCGNDELKNCGIDELRN